MIVFMNRKLHSAAQAVRRRTQRAGKHEKVRFGLVGIVNTAVDFAVLNVLVGVFGVPLVVSNIASTTAAMLTSFSLNKKIVFRGNEGSTKRQLILFFAVTLSAIWLVQSSVIFIVFQFLESSTTLPEPILLNLAKLAGISAGLIWNYVGYSKIVFRKKRVKE